MAPTENLRTLVITGVAQDNKAPYIVLEGLYHSTEVILACQMGAVKRLEYLPKWSRLF